MPVTSMIISLWVINDRPLLASCGDAGFENEPIIASSSPAVTCHGWVLDCEHSPSTLGATYRPSALWTVPGKSGGGPPADGACEDCDTGNLCYALFRVHCSLQQKWLKQGVGLCLSHVQVHSGIIEFGSAYS